MSTAPAPTPATDAAPVAKPGKKKLIIILAAAAVILAGAGGGVVYVLKKQAAERAALAGEDGAEVEHDAEKADAAVPTFVPLDPFTVNLADREAERYAQVGVTLGVVDSKVPDLIKTYMPVIRNNILMVLAHKTSAELLERGGKDQLAEEIKREVSRAMGVNVPDAGAVDAGAADGATTKARAKTPPPVHTVYFSNFIIQ